MAITPNDFEKIWSSNASTPAYTFSDADYLEGWDFVGNLPPTRAQWNAIQKRTDEKMKYVYDHFGSPLVANTVADMTEQNRVYVYAGSEAGYTAGDWYYYDGNAWVSGGVYNAVVVQTDTTLTQPGVPADAEVTGKLLALTAERTVSPNIFSGYTESGYLDADTGEEGSNPNLVRTGFIELDTSKSTLFIIRETSPWTFYVYFYDENKDFISPRISVFSSTTTFLRNSISIPNGAKYFRTYRNINTTGEVCVSYTELDEVYPYGYIYAYSNTIQKCVDAQNDLSVMSDANIFDGSFPEDGYFDADGVDASSSNFKRTSYITIDGTKSMLYFVRTASPYTLVLCFYNANKVGLGRYTVFTNNATELKSNLSIPNNTTYIRMYMDNRVYSGNLMLSYEEYSDFIPYNAYILKDKVVIEKNLSTDLQEKIDANQFLNGKTIAFMGDSVIGNFYDTTGICAVLADKTGANVINCAFGGTRIAYRYGSNVKYPHWNALSGAGLADAIASGIWTAQDDAVAALTDAPSYFANRLATLKSVDWSTVDYVMWEYGTNDFMTEVALSDTADTTNMYAYDNAYRHVIETILTAYPNIRIITVTPTYRWYQSGGVFTDDSNTHIAYDYKGDPHKLTDFVAMAQSISREYQIPCIDDYYTLGANRFTRLAFWNSSDGTHPNAQGRQRIAEHISAGLKGLV